jgi:hypothetical protein
MATPTIRSTYVFDVGTVRALERIATRWKVSKSEALRRAIRAADGDDPDQANARLAALDKLQHSLGLTPATARAWSRRTTDARRAWSARGEARGR